MSTFRKIKSTFSVIFLLSVVFLHYGCYGQDFINSDLDGPISVSSSPTSWAIVPFTDANSLATFAGADIPDVCGVSAPFLISGINGIPYSGLTFSSGVLAQLITGSVLHEGIQQNVPGFIIGELYSVNFHQAVVKQSNGLDEEGSWSVYMDNALLGTSAISTSSLNFNSDSLVWEFRTINFVATAAAHTFKFLPADNDANQVTSATDITGALRMGIDSVYILPNCSNSIDLGNDTILCLGNKHGFRVKRL